MTYCGHDIASLFLRKLLTGTQFISVEATQIGYIDPAMPETLRGVRMLTSIFCFLLRVLCFS